MDAAQRKGRAEWSSIRRRYRYSRHEEKKRKAFVATRVRYVMGRFCRKSREETCSRAQAPSLFEALFGRIAAMQDLYISGTGTTTNRPSSRANLATATTPSSPGTAATTNGSTASCLEQNGRFHVRITQAVNGWRWPLSKKTSTREERAKKNEIWKSK